ncbi:MAG: two-component system sensor histidine kinase AlgZ [Gammaproteobacteria bacterium]|jgi:two-component system sensor histidine kinase AlgZ
MRTPLPLNVMSRESPNSSTGLFLPDFCTIRMAFMVLVIGELLAIVLTLGAGSGTTGGFRELALTSLFIQWVALGSSALLCVSRTTFERWGNAATAAASYVLILAVALAVSEAAWRFVLPRLSDPSLATVWEFAQQSDELGSLRPLTPQVAHIEFLWRNVGIAAVSALVALRYFYVQHQSRVRMESETRARIQALQSRIRPHFLFNSMNTIASLTRSDPAMAEQVTEDLAALFRVSLGDASVPGTLEEELEVCRQYLRIEAQRLGERLVSEVDTSAVPADALVPRLILQPLIENAVYHGVEPSPDGGRIIIGGQLDGQVIHLRVRNTVPRVVQPVRRSGNSMALDNVRQRLDVFFGGAARFSIDAQADHFTVSLAIPYRKRGD